MKYWTVYRETGLRIDCFDTKEKADRAIRQYVKRNMEHGIYSQDYYAVEEEPECMEGDE